MPLFTQEEINEFYALLGIGSEEERQRIQALKDIGRLPNKVQPSINPFTASPTGHKNSHGELERTPRPDQ